MGSSVLVRNGFASATALVVHDHFIHGKHVVSHTISNCFNSVWSDLGLEQTVVKDSKSRQGGIIGMSRQKKTTLKWYIMIHKKVQSCETSRICVE